MRESSEQLERLVHVAELVLRQCASTASFGSRGRRPEIESAHGTPSALARVDRGVLSRMDPRRETVS